MTEKPLVPSFVFDQGMVNSCLTRGADFEVYTGPLQVDENAESGHFVVNMIGSSTVTDLQGDTMTMSALDDMTKIPDNLTFFMNHSYEIPSDVLGGLYGRPWIKSSSGIADLHLSAEIEQSNPKAMQAYSMISKGKRRLGCSGGFQVLDYDYNRDTQALIIKSVATLEFSLVGIPANTRAWVEVATKSLFERALLEGRGDDALNLAPAVKGMYWRSYDSLVKHIESAGLKRDLERVTPRDTQPHRIMSTFSNGQPEFALSDNKGITKSLSRDEVSALLQKSAPVRVVEADPLPDMQKSVSGKTDLPLMDIGTEWTGSKAEKQIFDWARDDNDEIVASKAKQCFLSYDPDQSDKQSGYKMPFCYIENGSPKIVPLGVRACANVLSGGMGGVSASGSDKDGMKAKVKTLYGRINSQFKPDPEWVVPWEKDKAATVETTKDILDSDNGKDLVRQDLKETDDMDKDTMPKASEVEVSADGSHAACTGTHTHAHKAYGSQGDDDLHEHEHAHDGDAHHGHSHEETKDLGDAPTVEKQIEVASESEEVAEVTKSVEPAPVAEDPQRVALLAAYNTIGKQLGFEPANFEQKCAMGDANMQQAIGLISQADACIDGLAYRLAQADSYIDQLMNIYGIPDVDKMPDSDEVPAMLPMVSYSAEVSFLKSFESMLLQKEGKELNEKNRGIIAMMHDHSKSVHDMAAAMHPDCCKCDGMTSQGTDVESARQDAQYQMADGLTRSMDALAQALEKFTPDVLAQALEKFSPANLEKSFKRMKGEESSLHTELANLKSNINALKNMPLGRPTQLNRSIEGEASYEDLKVAVGQHVTLKDALKSTELVALGGSQYRRWPAGAGVGLRPALTTDQKSLMRPDDIIAYQDGGAAYVPVIDDPEA